MCISIATMENNMEIPQKASNSIVRDMYIYMNLKSVSQRDIGTLMFIVIIHNNQDMVSMNRLNG
jgi:hypothetical protein